MKEILDFTAQFKATINLNEKLVVKRKKRYFLLNENLKSHLHEDYYYIGIYLGKTKEGRFFPSFNLLAMMARGRARKIVVDRKTEWLFICGRDIFKRGILRTTDSMRKGDYTLVVNQHGECLGFGRLLCNVDEEVDRQKVIVRNISDVGDFLRRER
ncbi:hypothetical protein E3J51_05035 [Candidatus Bathyarchaeota archaeon]|nr:MAG: hypothetical protein E3J51_05035 [Candidatus Bathyarchaeota archaeon]